MSKRAGGIQSMTGYGRASRRTAAGSITVEFRSTNHRYLEVDQRLPNVDRLARAHQDGRDRAGDP